MLTFNKPTFLGIDFGMSHIKAVELTLKNEHPYLLNYGEVLVDISDLQSGIGRVQTPDEKIQSLLVALLRKMAPKSEAVHVAMPGFSGLITLIELPQMSKTELESAVRFEAQRYIPSPLSEVVLSWDVVSSQTHSKPDVSGKASGNVEILLVAALHKEVEKYEKYVASSHLKMQMLELETFSLARSLVPESSGTVLIVDIGSRSTNLILVENGFIKINRNINAGGHEITTTLSEALNISWERADMVKCGDKDFLNNKESTIVFPSLELVVNESRRMLAAYAEKHQGAHVDHLIISGGTSKMQGIDAYFSKALELPVRVGDPWSRISYDERLRSAISKLGAAYSVAVGLALAGIESYERS
ncbi:MAG: type IV pilus assembly protein PilM [Candidatus Moranbacteria bacterium]|nr:type IV pilus assembly protein PilM [Candidatus Moranbacteria bacterium]